MKQRANFQKFSVHADTFLSALAKCATVMPGDLEARYYMCGVNLELNPGQMNLTATDGTILCTVAIDYDSDHAIHRTLTLPPESVRALLRNDTLGIISRDVPLQFAFSFADCEVSNGRHRIWFPLVDGDYPKWRRVIPDEQGTYTYRSTTSQILDTCKARKNKRIRGKVPDFLQLDYEAGFSLAENSLGAPAHVAGYKCSYLSRLHRMLGLSATAARDADAEIVFSTSSPKWDPVRITSERAPGALIVMMPARV